MKSLRLWWFRKRLYYSMLLANKRTRNAFIKDALFIIYCITFFIFLINIAQQRDESDRLIIEKERAYKMLATCMSGGGLQNEDGTIYLCLGTHQFKL